MSDSSVSGRASLGRASARGSSTGATTTLRNSLLAGIDRFSARAGDDESAVGSSGVSVNTRARELNLPLPPPRQLGPSFSSPRSASAPQESSAATPTIKVLNPLGPEGAARKLAQASPTSSLDKPALSAVTDFSGDASKPPLGIPVRELLMEVYAVKRARKLCDALVYVGYAVIFFIIYLNVAEDVTVQSVNSSIYDGLLTQEFVSTGTFTPVGSSRNATIELQSPFKKTFFDVNSLEELQKFVEGPFFSNLYQDSWYNNEPLDAVYNGYFRYNQRVLGSVRLWQARVDSSKCSVQRGVSNIPGVFIDAALVDRQYSRQQGGFCIPSFSSATESRADFGPATARNRYKYTPDTGHEFLGLSGKGVASYGSGGFVAYLPSDKKEVALSTWGALVDDRWFDAMTRAVAIDFSLLNSDTATISAVQLLVEFLPSSAVVLSYKIMTTRYSLYETLVDQGRFVFEIIFLLMTLWYAWQEFLQLRKTEPWYRYFKMPSNVFDLVILGLIAALGTIWMLRHTFSTLLGSTVFNSACDATAPPQPTAAGPPTCYYPQVWDYLVDFRNVLTLGGATSFLLTMKVFKYFSIDPNLSAIFLTLEKAWRPLVAFFISFSLLLFAFAFMGMSFFGPCLNEFRSLGFTINTLIRYPLGDFSYVNLETCNPTAAAPFFVTYMVCVFLICLNVAVAILTLAYERVDEKIQKETNWKHATRSTLSDFVTAFRVHTRWYLRFFFNPHGDSKKIGGDGGDFVDYICQKHYQKLLVEFIDVAEHGYKVDFLKFLDEIYSGLIPGVVTYISLDELCYRTLQRDKNGVPKQSKFCEEKHIGDVPTLTDERARKRDTNLCCSCLFSRHTHLSDGLGPRLKLSQVPADPAYFTTVSKKLGYRQADSKPGGADASANAAAIPLRMPNQLVHADGERCIAWQLVQAYFASRKVISLRSAHRHSYVPQIGKDERSDDNKNRWSVVKRDRQGKESDRVVCLEVDGPTGSEACYFSTRNKQFDSRRRINIMHIVLIESSFTQPGRLILHVENNVKAGGDDDSVVRRDEDSHKNRLAGDTVYDIEFDDRTTRERFVELLHLYYRRYVLHEREDMNGQDQESEDQELRLRAPPVVKVQ